MAKSIREKKLEQYIKDASVVSLYCVRVRCYVKISKTEARRLVKLETTGEIQPLAAMFRNGGKELCLS